MNLINMLVSALHHALTLRRSALFAIAVAAVFTVACGGEEAPPAEAAAPAPAPAPAAAPEVFFTNVEDGGTYTSPVDFVFGVENFAIVPIETPLVARPGEGHYHLAVDAECAAVGAVIVAGDPAYIHFGTGNNDIAMQFEPGEHTLCLQVADGEHRVIDGPEHSLLTKEIRITVE
jgi:hypothetical protein